MTKLSLAKCAYESTQIIGIFSFKTLIRQKISYKNGMTISDIARELSIDRKKASTSISSETNN